MTENCLRAVDHALNMHRGFGISFTINLPIYGKAMLFSDSSRGQRAQHLITLAAVGWGEGLQVSSQLNSRPTRTRCRPFSMGKLTYVDLSINKEWERSFHLCVIHYIYFAMLIFYFCDMMSRSSS
ncbi:hypothetical protein DYH55_00305 [Methylovirgula sp. 4M-Z18]|nr:hypothetical protein DYH55_00305 [Methylovirgula sp. 4M-Z18]